MGGGCYSTRMSGGMYIYHHQFHLIFAHFSGNIFFFFDGVAKQE
jgi:hypothetical protein